MRKIIVGLVACCLFLSGTSYKVEAAKRASTDVIEYKIGEFVSISGNGINSKVDLEEQPLLTEEFIMNNKLKRHRVTIPVFLETRTNPMAFVYHLYSTKNINI